MAAKRSSAAVLEALWGRFKRDIIREHGPKLSKRLVSREIFKNDEHLLARWTNPGDKETWRIPLSRIRETVKHLRGTPEDLDDLMLARLNEVRKRDREDDVFHAIAWALGHVERTLPADERFLLLAYRSAAECCPHQLFAGNESRAQMIALLEGMAKAQMEQVFAENLLDGQETDEDRAALKQRANQVMEKLKPHFAKLTADQQEQAAKREAAEREAEQAAERKLLDSHMPSLRLKNDFLRRLMRESQEPD